MENQTRFDLNPAVEHWRQALAAQANLTSEVRRELETHLRDTITALQQRGLNDEESFWLARRRVGQPKQIGEEFTKADPAKVWRERAFLAAASMLAILIWNTLSYSFSALLGHAFVPSDGKHQLYYHVLYVLMVLFPLVWLMKLVAGGRMHREFETVELFFRSRFRFGAAAVALIVLSHFLLGVSNGWPYWTGRYTFTMLVQFWAYSLVSTMLPLTLVGLLVWLMPKQGQRTSSCT